MHLPSAQNERGQAAVPSSHIMHGAPITGQSASLAHSVLEAGRQNPGQSAPSAGSQLSFGASAHS